MATTAVDPLFDRAVLEDPHPYYAQLRESDPVHLIEGTDAYLVSRLDLVHEVVANPAIYSSRSSEFLYLGESNQPGLRPPGIDSAGAEDMPGVLATADPPDHGRQRKILSRVLSTAAINAREGDFRTLIDAALDPPLASGRVEWMGEIAEPLPMVMVARLLGLPDGTAPAQKMTEMGPVVDAYVAARAAAVPDQTTVIGACARAVADGQLDDMEVFGILGILLAAGGESTTSLLGTGVRMLAERRDLQDRLRAHPALIPGFVEEACRVEPPFRGHYRRVLTDTTLGGVPLAVGS